MRLFQALVVADSSTSTGLKWAAASAGGWTLLYTVDLSGNTTLTQNVDFSGYEMGILIADNVSTGANGNWNLITSFNASATGNYATDVSFNSASVETVVNDTTAGQRGSGGAQVQQTECHYVLTVYNPASTTKFKAFDYTVTYTRNAAGNPIWTQNRAGYFRSDSAITSIKFESGSGNMTAGSQVLIYGVK